MTTKLPKQVGAYDTHMDEKLSEKSCLQIFSWKVFFKHPLQYFHANA